MGKACDYLLVGQGLAGTSLAMHLLDLGASVFILDDHRPDSSSRVAAGLFNPVTGRKMVKTWMADKLFPYLIDYYRKLEALTGCTFLHERPIYRPFLTIEEQNEWMGKSASSEFIPYIKDVFHGKEMSGVRDNYGGILLKNSGYLNIPEYLDAMERYFRDLGIFVQETFNPEELIIQEDHAEYGNFTFRQVIFCDGTSGGVNTFFDWLPFRPVKGELMEVTFSKRFPVIINRGVFVLEIENGIYRVGSTYNNRQPDWNPSEDGASYIMEKLGQLVEESPVVQRHYAGVRPATADRRPFMGKHPEYSAVGVFNGLGTKGVSISPWFGRHFASHLMEEKPLLEDVNISRYFSLY